MHGETVKLSQVLFRTAFYIDLWMFSMFFLAPSPFLSVFGTETTFIVILAA